MKKIASIPSKLPVLMGLLLLLLMRTSRNAIATTTGMTCAVATKTWKARICHHASAITFLITDYPRIMSVRAIAARGPMESNLRTWTGSVSSKYSTMQQRGIAITIVSDNFTSDDHASARCSY